MTDYKPGLTINTHSLRVSRLDNGFIRFSICQEPSYTTIAFVDLSPDNADHIVEIIKRLRSEQLS
jgi:hypothetical protein